MNEPRRTAHANQRMKERHVTEADVRSALTRRSGTPVPGSLGKKWVFGYDTEGRILKLLLTADEETLITVARPDDD